MNDDLDIEQFLNESFKKIENKVNKKKKIETVTKKYTPTESIVEKDVKVNLQNVINDNIYTEINKESKEKININDVLMPMFPNEKVFQKEFTSDKIFLLDKYIGNNIANSKKEVVAKKCKNKQFKKMREATIIKKLREDQNLKYGIIFETMNSLWNSYITHILNKTNQADSIYSKVIKADLHGSIIEVVTSKNKTLLGLKGILILETRRTFNILTSEDEFKTLLKAGSTFKLELPFNETDTMKHTIFILGDNFVYKAVERTKAKFKIKYIL